MNSSIFLSIIIISFVPLCEKQKRWKRIFDIREHQLTSRERDFENALRPLKFFLTLVGKIR